MMTARTEKQLCKSMRFFLNGKSNVLMELQPLSCRDPLTSIHLKKEHSLLSSRTVKLDLCIDESMAPFMNQFGSQTAIPPKGNIAQSVKLLPSRANQHHRWCGHSFTNKSGNSKKMQVTLQAQHICTIWPVVLLVPHILRVIYNSTRVCSEFIPFYRKTSSTSLKNSDFILKAISRYVIEIGVGIIILSVYLNSNDLKILHSHTLHKE
ncbi:hypothetical protein EGR_10877 [Echinococcus granulosus]|uniref:Uncharacterized protein n=1 Tax=Echinococcus granulosus TaxID=6210 RepID=W6U199_ECHGR|nr:hypothetical protein EGR_10877 [Echinococcus granulosus]EUB54266.1 hypothetical protein EGR_10877 [Echinococcus granulosus]